MAHETSLRLQPAVMGRAGVHTDLFFSMLDLLRRNVDVPEKKYLMARGVVTEMQSNMGKHTYMYMYSTCVYSVCVCTCTCTYVHVT